MILPSRNFFDMSSPPRQLCCIVLCDVVAVCSLKRERCARQSAVQTFQRYHYKTIIGWLKQQTLFTFKLKGWLQMVGASMFFCPKAHLKLLLIGHFHGRGMASKNVWHPQNCSNHFKSQIVSSQPLSFTSRDEPILRKDWVCLLAIDEAHCILVICHTG